jgi:hypothetical protein
MKKKEKSGGGYSRRRVKEVEKPLIMPSVTPELL